MNKKEDRIEGGSGGGEVLESWGLGHGD